MPGSWSGGMILVSGTDIAEGWVAIQVQEDMTSRVSAHFIEHEKHVQVMPCDYLIQILDSRCIPAEAIAVDTAYTVIVVDMTVVGIEVEVLEMYIPWVGSCSL